MKVRPCCKANVPTQKQQDVFKCKPATRSAIETGDSFFDCMRAQDGN